MRNLLLEDKEGGYTIHFPTSEQIPIFDASMRYQEEGTSLVIIAGKEYGTGSSRDWAAKGTGLLGVKAVIAESYERIHRSNLVGMGVLPLQFLAGEDATALGLSGRETYSITGVADGLRPGALLDVVASREDGTEVRFRATARLDSGRGRGLLPERWHSPHCAAQDGARPDVAGSSSRKRASTWGGQSRCQTSRPARTIRATHP